MATPNALGATATAGGTYLSVQPNRSLLTNTAQRTPTKSFFALGAAIDPRGSGTIPTGSLQPVAGALNQIAVGADGTIIGTNNA